MNPEEIFKFLENICHDEKKTDKTAEVIEIDIEIVTTKRTVIDTILS
ncbi:hypothetical protein IKQ26_08075 [bacterium]|nr:hypothetical protein [bacterium]